MFYAYKTKNGRIGEVLVRKVFVLSDCPHKSLNKKSSCGNGRLGSRTIGKKHLLRSQAGFLLCILPYGTALRRLVFYCFSGWHFCI